MMSSPVKLQSPASWQTVLGRDLPDINAVAVCLCASTSAAAWGEQLPPAKEYLVAYLGPVRQHTWHATLHLGHLRRLLDVRQATPHGAVLRETGEQPPWVCWLLRAGRLRSRVLAEPQGSLLHRALPASRQLAVGAPAELALARRPCAAKLAAELVAVGMPVDLQNHRFSVWRSCGGQSGAAPAEELIAAAAGLAPPSSPTTWPQPWGGGGGGGRGAGGGGGGGGGAAGGARGAAAGAS